MTKKQKIWFWIGLALFVIPEVLWSPIGNIFYEFSQHTSSVVPFRNSYVMSVDHAASLSIVLGVQVLGVLMLFTLALQHWRKDWRFFPLHIMLFVLLIVAAWFFYLSLAFNGW